MFKKFFIIFLLFTLSGCSPRHSEDKIRMGDSVWLGYEFFHLAKEKGFLDASRVRFVELTSNTAIIRALRNGLLEVAVLTLDEAVKLAAEGVDIKIILVLDESHGGDAVLVRPGIASVSDLKGKRIGVEPGTVSSFLFENMLYEQGIEADAMTMVPMEVWSQPESFVKGEVDAVVTYEPFKSVIEQHGGHVVYDSSMMQNKITDVLVVRTESLKEHPEKIRSLVDGWYLGIEYYRQYPEESRPIVNRRLKLEPAAYKRAFEGIKVGDRELNAYLFDARENRLKRRARETIRFLEKKGLVADKPESLDTLIFDMSE